MPPRRNTKGRSSKPRRRHWGMRRRKTQSVSSPNKVYSFKRVNANCNLKMVKDGAGNIVPVYSGTPPAGWITDATTGAMGFAFAFSDMVEYSEFVRLFDQYKITGIGVRLQRIVTTDPSRTAQIFAAIDNDNVTLTTLNDLRQHADLKRWDITGAATRPFKIFIKNPKKAVTAFQSAVSSGYVSSSAWTDAAYYDVKHYGLRMFLGNCAEGDQFSVEVTYYFQCKGVQ